MAGIDEYTKLVLHCDGDDGSTDFPDSSDSEHTVSAAGSAEVDTAQKVFGTGSLISPGSGHHLTVPNSDDWDILTTDRFAPFTVDYRVRFNSLSSWNAMFGQYESASLSYGGAVGFGTLAFVANHTSGLTRFDASWTPSLDTWYHIAFVRDSSANQYIFINGISQSLTIDTSNNNGNITGDFMVGWGQLFGGNSDCWIDEFRLSKGIARWTESFTPPTEAYALDGPPPLPPAAKELLGSWFQNPQIPRLKKSKTNPGFFDIAGLEDPVPIKIDKWEHIKNYPVREIKRNKANKGQFALVEFNVPDPEIITLDKWFQQSPVPRRKKILNRTNLFDVDYIEAIQGAGGNFFDTGVYGLEITVTSEEAQTYLDETAFGFEITVTSDEDFQLEDHESIDFVIAYPDTGVEVFNSHIPGYIGTTVMIDGNNESSMIQGIVNVIREDNSAARFTVILNMDPDIDLPRKPVELINKVITINFSAADMSGIVADYVPVFVGKIKHVVYNADIKSYTLSGYDYGGIHQTKGEFVSDNVTGVLTGQIYASSAGTIATGNAPIWGVVFNGSDEVIDGTDYFVDTLNGTITVPISSRIIQFPNYFTYNYMDPFDSMRSIIQSVATIKGWEIEEDNITIADFTGVAEHPVLSLSDESVIDVCRKFLELSGAKVETNLYPKLRVYSEVENFINAPRLLTVDESMIFENALIYNINFDDILNEQTVRSVQKVNSAINIGDLQTLASFSGSTPTLNPLAVQDPPPASFWDIDLNMKLVLVEHRINKQGIQTISLSSSGKFFAYGLGGYWEETISAGSWTQFADGDDFVFQLKHRPVAFYLPGTTMIAYPATEYSLTVNGTKISYGTGDTEDIKVVTAQRAIGGISETLRGDTYENAYIETDTHCANICNAILLEYGNPYTAQFEIPLFEAKDAQIGDKIIIQKDSVTNFYGLIKMLNYNVNTRTGENRVSISARGVGVGI